jgi:hypothetical protein
MNNPFTPGPLGAEIIASLRSEPEKWSQSRYGLRRFYHGRNIAIKGIGLWESGRITHTFFGDRKTTIIERWHLRRAVRAWKRRAM